MQILTPKSPLQAAGVAMYGAGTFVAYSERSALPLAMQWRGGWGARKEFLTDS